MGDEGDGGLGSEVGTAVVALLLALFTLNLAYTGVVGIVQIQYANQQAVTTTGTVTETDVTSHRWTDDGVEKVEYTPQVVYEYTVDGTRYNSTAFYDDWDHTPSYRAESDARAALPEPGNVTVYYMPDDPDRSFLVRPSVDWAASGIVAVVALCVGLLSSLVFLFSFKSIAGAS